VAGVVGFYSFFSTVPRGRHLIRVCLGTACYVRGGKLVLDALKQELCIDVGGTTEDRLFSLDVGRCFGACGLAPTIMVGEEVRQRVKPARIRAILAEYRNGAGAAGAEGGNGKGVKGPAPKVAKPKPKAKAAKPRTSARKSAGQKATGHKATARPKGAKK
jgi:hypothetical protein